MDAGTIGIYLVGLLLFAASSIACIYVYGWIAPVLSARLDGSATNRATFFFLVQIIGNMFVTGIFDKIDLSRVLAGDVGALQMWLLWILAGFVPPWFGLTWCGFQRGEKLAALNAQLQNEKDEVICQRDFLAGLLEGIRATVGEYAQLISNRIDRDGKGIEDPTVQVNPRNFIGHVIDACKEAYRAVQSKEGGYSSLAVVLLRPDENGTLCPEYSYDGEKIGFFNSWFNENRHLFSIHGHARYPATLAYTTGVEIWPRVEDKNDAHDSRFTFPDDKHRNLMRSLIAISLDTDEYEIGESEVCRHEKRRVLMIFSDREYAFSEGHRWKAMQIQKHVCGRIQLLMLQQCLHDRYLSNNHRTSPPSDAKGEEVRGEGSPLKAPAPPPRSNEKKTEESPEGSDRQVE